MLKRHVISMSYQEDVCCKISENGYRVEHLDSQTLFAHYTQV